MGECVNASMVKGEKSKLERAVSLIVVEDMMNKDERLMVKEEMNKSMNTSNVVLNIC